MRKQSVLILAVLIGLLAGCGGSGDEEPTEVVTTFSNAIPLSAFSADEGFVMQVSSDGGSITEISSESGGVSEAQWEAENEQTGGPVALLNLAAGEDQLTLYLPPAMEAIPYPIRSWEALEAGKVQVYASIQYAGNTYARNVIGTLRVSKVGDGKFDATLYLDGANEDGSSNVSVAAEFRGLAYPASE